jgi:hypothetical protein
LKNTKEAMIKTTPTAMVKIPNCLGMNHLIKKRCTHHAPTMRCNQVKIYIWKSNLINSTANYTTAIADLRSRAAAAFLAFSW